MMFRKMLVCCGKAVSCPFALAIARISSPNIFGMMHMCSILTLVWNGCIRRIQWFAVGVHCERGNMLSVLTRSPPYARSSVSNCSLRVSVLNICSSVPSVILCVL